MAERPNLLVLWAALAACTDVGRRDDEAELQDACCNEAELTELADERVTDVFSGDSAEDIASEPPDSTEDQWEAGGERSCSGHYDCFGQFYECVDGIVRFYLSRPIECEEWTGECPWEEAYRCEQGCAPEARFHDEPGVALHCAGHPFSVPGDRCITNWGCVARPTEYVDGVFVADYLVCDIEAQECRYVDPPEAGDFGASCSTGLRLRRTSRIRINESPDCRTMCADQWDAAAGCMRGGCSRHCDDDRDCPAGTRCDLSAEVHIDLSIEPLYWGVCVPGPEENPLRGWTCPPAEPP